MLLVTNTLLAGQREVVPPPNLFSVATRDRPPKQTTCWLCGTFTKCDNEITHDICDAC